MVCQMSTEIERATEPVRVSMVTAAAYMHLEKPLWRGRLGALPLLTRQSFQTHTFRLKATLTRPW